MFKIVPHTKPLNHRLWTLIYLLAMFLGLMVGPVFGNEIQKVKPIDRIEYRNRMVENYYELLRLRRLLYGETQGQAEAQAQARKYGPASSNRKAPLPKRRQARRPVRR